MDPFSHQAANPNMANGYRYANGNPVNMVDPSGYFTLTELMSTIKTHAVIISLSYIGANFLYNVGSFITADPISKKDPENSGVWITSMVGLALKFGPFGGAAGIMTARGTSTGRAIVGVVGGGGLTFPASKVKDGLKYLSEHRSDLAAAIRIGWDQNPFDNGLSVLKNILEGFRAFSQWFG
ncbi:unnamed protein product, partial [marine sediment metagenome]